jgi:LysR family transcriptional regulator, glycine cleavage system transcriptional activator
VRDSPSELRLPPLNALRAFEAAGRLENIRAAAGELVVTPGAVSRHIRVLEDWLGVTLFRRTAHSVSLTPVGQAYLAAVGPHLRGIAVATERIAAAAPEFQLRVRTWTSFAGWLVPRLAEFRRLNPGVEVQLIASSQGTEFHQADVDVEIIGYGKWDEAVETYPESDLDRPADPAHKAVAVLHTHIVCVCSPAYLADHGTAAPGDLRRSGDHCLLQSLSTPELWDRWLRAAGVVAGRSAGGVSAGSRRELVYGDAALTAQAARAGEGIAILPETVVRDDIDEGRLVVLFGPDVVSCPFDYYLLASPDRLRRRPVQLFRDWLGAQPV